jgi:hypothetical protein
MANLTQTYSYHAITSENTIRVLFLDPGSGDDPLRGKLEFVDIGAETVQEFWALSYVWGSPGKQGIIDLGGGYGSVGQNLETAVRRFRRSDQVTAVWADALCINQDDVKERGGQVSLMGLVYSKAQRVVVWLGPDPLNKAAETFATLRRKRDLDITDSERAAVGEMLKCEWFTRLWVVQEVILARHADFFWGEETIPLKKVRLSAHLFNWMKHHEEAIWIGEIQSQKRNWDFIEVLRWTRTQKCWDDRDRIYAILGLPYTKDKQFIGAIKPDYTKTVQQLYHDVAAEVVQNGQFSRLWTSIGHTRDWNPINSDMPSWVPDWSKPQRPYHILAADDADDDDTDDEEPRPPSYSILSSRGNSLFVRGCIIATISSHEAPYSASSPFQKSVERVSVKHFEQGTKSMARQAFWSRLERFAAFWQQNVKSLKYTPRDTSGRDNTFLFAEMLLACTIGCGVQDEPWSFDLARTIAYDAEVVGGKMEDVPRALGQMLRAFKKSVKRLPSEYDPFKSGVHYPLVTGFFLKLDPIWQCHKLFVTSKGHSALGPGVLQVGDVVVILAGCEYPVILRPHKSWFFFVGIAYVSDIRNSDIKKVWSTEEADLQLFELR